MSTGTTHLASSTGRNEECTNVSSRSRTRHFFRLSPGSGSPRSFGPPRAGSDVGGVGGENDGSAASPPPRPPQHQLPDRRRDLGDAPLLPLVGSRDTLVMGDDAPFGAADEAADRPARPTVGVGERGSGVPSRGASSVPRSGGIVGRLSSGGE